MQQQQNAHVLVMYHLASSREPTTLVVHDRRRVAQIIRERYPVVALRPVNRQNISEFLDGVSDRVTVSIPMHEWGLGLEGDGLCACAWTNPAEIDDGGGQR